MSCTQNNTEHNLLSYEPADRHHCSDDVCWKGGGSVLELDLFWSDDILSELSMFCRCCITDWCACSAICSYIEAVYFIYLFIYLWLNILHVTTAELNCYDYSKFLFKVDHYIQTWLRWLTRYMYHVWLEYSLWSSGSVTAEFVMDLSHMLANPFTEFYFSCSC